MTVSETEASGTLVVEARDVAKAYGDRPIVRDLSLRIAKGDRLGIVGANGTGKTTLVNLLTGRLPPDEGIVKVGANVTLNLLDQRRSALDPERTVADVLTGGGSDSVQVGNQSRHVIGYMKDFLFSPEQARTPVSVLSGGERNRLLLARALAEAGNLLVLDEPTNDLDLETLDLLQEMLGEYAGTLILVSHDRDFLDRVVDTVLVSEGEGRWVAYAGGYSDMVAQRGVGVQARGSSRQAQRMVQGTASRRCRSRLPPARPPGSASASTSSTSSRPCRPGSQHWKATGPSSGPPSTTRPSMPAIPPASRRSPVPWRRPRPISRAPRNAGSSSR